MERDLVLDASALIALQRGDRGTAILLNAVQKAGFEVHVPSSALAQAWRGGPGSAVLSRIRKGSQLDVLGEKRAKEVGVRLGARDRSDVVDCHVVCCALEHRAVIATSDINDLRALADPGEPLALIGV
jgi:hypothetical protein